MVERLSIFLGKNKAAARMDQKSHAAKWNVGSGSPRARIWGNRKSASIRREASEERTVSLWGELSIFL